MKVRFALLLFSFYCSSTRAPQIRRTMSQTFYHIYFIFNFYFYIFFFIYFFFYFYLGKKKGCGEEEGGGTQMFHALVLAVKILHFAMLSTLQNKPFRSAIADTTLLSYSEKLKRKPLFIL